MSDTRPLLIFDGDCAFCTSSVRFIERRMKRQPRIEPWQTLDLGALALTQEQCETAVQWVDRGVVASGHIAVARLLVFAGKGWAVLGYGILLPGIRQIAGLVYRWVAKNRGRLPGGTAQCSLPQNQRPNADNID